MRPSALFFIVLFSLNAFSNTLDTTVCGNCNPCEDTLFLTLKLDIPMALSDDDKNYIKARTRQCSEYNAKLDAHKDSTKSQVRDTGEWKYISIYMDWHAIGSTPNMDSRGMMLGSRSAFIRRHFFTIGSGQEQELNFFGTNLRPYLNPKSGALAQMNVVAIKKVVSVLSLAGGIVCLLVATFACNEETGSYYGMDRNGNWGMQTDSRMNSTGLALSWTSLGLGINSLYCFFSWPVNLEFAVKHHNNYMQKKRTSPTKF